MENLLKVYDKKEKVLLTFKHEGFWDTEHVIPHIKTICSYLEIN